MEQQFPAVVLTVNDTIKKKSNTKEYHTALCEITLPNGKIKAMCNRTLGENKTPIREGMDVTVYPSVAEVDGKKVAYFEISTGISTTPMDDIITMLGL